MTPTFDDVVEAMARARYERFVARMNAALQPMPPWDQLPEMMQATVLDDVRHVLRAQRNLGLLLVAGVPDEMDIEYMGTSGAAHAAGFNACRADVLARVVEVPK